jgi:[methyl-Co(III) methanol-specific corrinoid protein]:coenzyme M methyltransferase
MAKMGVYFPEAHTDARAMAELASGGYEILGFDTIMPEFSVQQEAAALGCDVDWGSQEMMPAATTHPVKTLDDVIIPENILEKPALKVVLEAIALLRKEYGDRVAIVGKAMGPWTICYNVIGLQDFLIMTCTAPDTVKKFLDAYKEVSIKFANAQITAGADAVCLPDHATGDLVSPQTYREFLVPVHKEMLGRIGGPTILHICGDCSDRLDIFAEENYDAYHISWEVDLKKAIATVNGRMSLIGNVNNAQTLLRGTPDDVYKQAREAISAGIDIVAPECAVPLQTPIANLKAIVAAAVQGY